MKDLFRKKFNKTENQSMSAIDAMLICRVLLIPAIACLYFLVQSKVWVIILFILSTLVDVANFVLAQNGKRADDFDKFLGFCVGNITQICILACLSTKFSRMILVLAVLFIKEIALFVLKLQIYKNTQEIEGAHWHGILSTVVVILTIVLHLAIGNIPASVSDALALFSIMFMVYSGFLYMLEGMDVLKNGKRY